MASPTSTYNCQIQKIPSFQSLIFYNSLTMLGKYAIASIGKQISGGDISSELSEIERKKAAKDALVAF
jgi:hypothetical protein